MEPETQVKEMAARVEPKEPSVVDLNQATAEELETLAGIGPSLARRIVAYREEQGSFHSPEELTAIPGIGSAAYERVVGRLTVVPPEIVLPTAEETVPEEVPETAVPSPEVPAAREVPPPEARETALEEELVPPAEEAPAADEAPAPPRVEPTTPPPSPMPPRKTFRRDMVSWIGAALVGGLLGMVLTLVVLYGINGALDLSNSPAFVELDSEVSNLVLEGESMQGKIDGLETRLDTLKGLTARVTQAEADVSELSQETDTLRELADGLDSRLGDVSDRVTAVEERSDRVTTFFERLTALLQELFGAEAEIEPAPESPVETPTPTE